MTNNLEQMNELTCLYYIGFQKRLELGITEEQFDDVSCSLCYRERQSAILCPHYTNKRHLEEFKRLDIRI